MLRVLPFERRWFAFVASAAVALSGLGCASIAGDQDANTKFLVKPGASGNFYGWSEITINDDTSQVSTATLDFVTLARLDDPMSGDLTFIHSVSGTAGPTQTLVAKKDSMPAGEHSVPLDIVYHDNLKPLFPDGHTIHVDWNGVADTSQIPTDGIWLDVHVRVHIE